MKELLNILKSISDETRLRIINLLYDGKERCVCDIMETLQISQAKASRHLTYLKNAGLASDRRHAQWVYYSMIKTESMKFLETLVYDNLRNIELFKEDLKCLEKECAKRKNTLCD